MESLTANKTTKDLNDSQSSARDVGIKAVLFDLGDTLLNFGRVDTTKLFKSGAKLTYDYLKRLSQPVGDFKPYCYRNLGAIRWKYWVSMLRRRDFDTLKLLKKINQAKGLELSDKQWDELVWLWYEPLGKCATVEPDIKNTWPSSVYLIFLMLDCIHTSFLFANPTSESSGPPQSKSAYR